MNYQDEELKDLIEKWEKSFIQLTDYGREVLNSTFKKTLRRVSKLKNRDEL